MPSSLFGIFYTKIWAKTYIFIEWRKVVFGVTLYIPLGHTFLLSVHARILAMTNSQATVLFGLAGVMLSGVIVYHYFTYRELATLLAVTKQTAQDDARAAEIRYRDLSATTTVLYGLLASTTRENEDLSARLGLVVSDNTTLSQQVVTNQTQIAILNKLRTTDKELLQKYSKVYFLNENYTPSSLVVINPDFVFDKKKTLQFHGDAMWKLNQMLSDATSTGHALSLISAYRSFKEQTSLKNQYSVIYGKGANSFSADQGYSEHQLGTAIDLTTPKLGNNYTSLDKSDAYTWLLENGWRYGFIQSYPKNNAFYVYEPWHWRFVGVELAAVLHNNNKNFYDLEQRMIDEFLLNIFN